MIRKEQGNGWHSWKAEYRPGDGSVVITTHETESEALEWVEQMNTERIIPRDPGASHTDMPKVEILGTKTQQCISDVMKEIEEMLLAKNRAYGDSALDPVRIFSRSDELEQLRVRIDDKLSRVMRGKDYPGEDTIDDLIGYLVILKIAMRNS